MKYIFTALLLIMIVQFSFGQVGTITGIVLDKETKEGLIAASVTIYKVNKTTPIAGTSTDIAGKFTLDSIPTGIYDIEYTYVGYTPLRVSKVEIKANDKLIVKIELKEEVYSGFGCGGYIHRLINQDEPFTGRVYSADDIRNLPIKW